MYNFLKNFIKIFTKLYKKTLKKQVNENFSYENFTIKNSKKLEFIKY